MPLRQAGLTGLRVLRVAGQAVATADSNSATVGTSLTKQVPRCSGKLLELQLTSGQSLRMAVTIRSLGLPMLPLVPATFVAMPGHNSLTTQVQQEFWL